MKRLRKCTFLQQQTSISSMPHFLLIARFDVHGIASPVDETPGVLNEKLEQMERHLQKIRRKQAYELAKYMNKSYVTDRSRRIMFLRGDYFDAKLSAQRIVRHFEVKRALFGDGEVLGRDVVLADLNALDMRALESGYIQVLPSRDSSGRPVFSMAPMFRPAEIDVINGVSRACLVYCS